MNENTAFFNSWTDGFGTSVTRSGIVVTTVVMCDVYTTKYASISEAQAAFDAEVQTYIAEAQSCAAIMSNHCRDEEDSIFEFEPA